MAARPRVNPAKIVDRGDVLEGIHITARDSRVPYNVLRSMLNVQLPDQKAKRRSGFEEYSAVRVLGNMLARHTPARRMQMVKHKNENIGAESGNKIWVTPQSYGVLRWHDDYQPRTDRDWTVEFLVTFGDKEELVVTPFERTSDRTDACKPRVGQTGVFVYDQALIAGNCVVKHGPKAGPTTSTFPEVVGAGSRKDKRRLANVVIPALSVSITNTQVQAMFALLDGAGNYEMYDEHLLTGIWPYLPGQTIHIAVTHETSTRTVRLVINGTERDSHTYDTGRSWAGEDDAINAYASRPLQRDIVLMNECAARGHYASTVPRTNANAALLTWAHGVPAQNAVHHTSTTSAVEKYAPRLMSPPRGLGMSNLRIWHEKRSDSDLNTYAYASIPTPLPANLKGWWRLNDGGGLCKDEVNLRRYVALHCTYPQFVNDESLLHGVGLHMSDSQYLHKRLADLTPPNTDIEAAGVRVYDTFRNRREERSTTAFSVTIEPESDFSVAIQFRTPYTYQQWLSKALGLNDTDANRDAYESTGQAIPSGRKNGPNATPQPKRWQTIRRTIDAAGNERDQYPYMGHRQMLWSTEGSSYWSDSKDGSHFIPQVPKSVPLVQCWLDEEGYVHVELYLRWFHTFGATAKSFGSKLHYKTSAPLLADQVYTVTVVKRTVQEGVLNNCDLHIYVNGTDLATVVTDDYPVDSGSVQEIKDTSPIEHEPSYSFIVGGAYVHDQWDYTANMGEFFLDGAKLMIDGYMALHRMYDCQDSPGFFTLGYWRLWSRGLSAAEVQQFESTSIESVDASADLVFNLEMDQVVGPYIKNKSRYPVLFELGYGVLEDTTPTAVVSEAGTFYTYAHHIAQWANRDCIGYRELPIPSNPSDIETAATCKMLAPFHSTIAQSSGLLAMFDEVLRYDKALDGVFSTVFGQNYGLLHEFSADQEWDSTLIGDKLVLVGHGGLPRVYDGKMLSTLGFPAKYMPSAFIASVAAASAFPDGRITHERQYGVVVAYMSESDNIVDISPRAVVWVPTGTKHIILFGVQPHPDPRVSHIRVYRTLGLTDPWTDPLFWDPDVTTPNVLHRTIVLLAGNDELATVILDENRTPPPICATAEEFNGQLYLAGDILVPDALYVSDAGNPQSFDTVASQIVVPEGSGDGIVGLAQLFGSLYIFKNSSVWRLDQTGQGPQLTRLTRSIGAVSRHSILVLVLPDTGVSVVFFWSKHGPYLFDGNNFRYVGQAVEGEGTPYDYMEPGSVRAIHNVNDREVICLYKPLGKDRHSEALVFKYRYGVWYRYNGQVAVNGIDLTVQRSSSGEVTDDGDPLKLAIDTVYKTLLGGSNGMVYSWGNSQYDGLPTAHTVIHQVVGATSTTILVVGTPFGVNALKGLWVVVRSSTTREWFTLPILSNTVNTIVVDTDYGTMPWVPTSPDVAFICFQPVEIEFPWDVMDLPFYDKQAVELYMWARGLLQIRYAIDWDAGSYTAWEDVPDGASQRQLITIEAAFEALKLHVASFAEDAQIDAFAYRVTYQREGDVPQ